MSLDSYYVDKPKETKKGGAKAQVSGKGAEEIVNKTNDAYEVSNRAYIRKMSIGFQPEAFGTQGRATGRVKKGPVDFLGVWNGWPVAFDVKSSDNKTSFPLANIEDHQMVFLNKWRRNGGLGFVLVRMVAWDKWYVVPYAPLVEAWRAADHGDGPKSLNKNWFVTNAIPVLTNSHGHIDYLAAVFVDLEAIRHG